jgi:hypothetical protein
VSKANSEYNSKVEAIFDTSAERRRWIRRKECEGVEFAGEGVPSGREVEQRPMTGLLMITCIVHEDLSGSTVVGDFSSTLLSF